METGIKDTLANGTTIVALGSVIMDYTNVITFFLVLTGVILNVIRIYELVEETQVNRVKDASTLGWGHESVSIFFQNNLISQSSIIIFTTL
jgi:hypothetical protein